MIHQVLANKGGDMHIIASYNVHVTPFIGLLHN